MKKIFSFSRTILLLFLLFLGVGQGWAITSDKLTTMTTSGTVVTDIITFTTAQNGGTTAPQISSSQLRLYQNANASVATGVRGGSITFKAATGYVIDKVTLDNADNNGCANAPVAYQVNGTGSWLDSTTVAKGGTYNTESNLGANTVEIASFGTTSSTRLYIVGITVEYRSTSGDSGDGDGDGEDPEPETPTYASLAELVAAGAPTTTAVKVNVTLTNEEIQSIYMSGAYRNGVNLLSGSQTVLIYSRNVPESWVAGGTVSGTLNDCDWKLYNGTWELCPADWSELNYTASSKTTPELSFSPAEYEITEGDDFDAPALINPQGVAVTYAASNVTPAGCIEVAENGTVTINGAGSATITASFVGNEEFNPASASYTLTVNEAADPNLAYTFDFTVNNFGLPTSARKDSEGSYTYDGKTIKLYGDATNGFKFNSTYLIMGKSGAYLTLPAFDFAVKKIVVVGNNGASGKVTQNIFVGETAVSAETTGATETYTYAINENYQAAGNVYTLKVTNGNNTQITKIYIYENPDAPVVPTLVVPESLTLEADATAGEFAYALSNPDGSTLTAEVNPEATWVSNVAVNTESKKVTFTTTANGPSAAREATITVTYGSIQKEVTITQKREVLDHVDLPFAVAAGSTGAALKEMDGVAGSIDGSDYNNETHKVKLSANTHYIQVKTNERIGVCTFSFKGAAAAGSSSFKLQESTDGTNWSDVESFTITFEAKNDVVEWASTSAFSADARYMKLAFLKQTGDVNCGLGAFSIAQYVAPAANGTLNFVATNEDGYWATFSSTQNVIFDANDVVVYTVAADGDALVMIDAYDNSYSCVTDKTKDDGWVAGYYVQAGVGVLINSLEESVNYYYIDTDPYTANDLNEIETDPEYNMLRAASVTKEAIGYKFYMLAYGDAEGNGLGFYWGADQGAAFVSREGSAYLAVPVGTTLAPAHFLFENEEQTATSIENIEATEVVKFIENGKVLIMKNGVVYDVLGTIVR